MGGGPLGCPAWLETPYDREPPGGGQRYPALLVCSQQLVDAKRNRHVVASSDFHAEKRCRRDANHRKCLTVETHRSADHAGSPPYSRCQKA